jgi:preprotein translocase subunit SecE
MILNIDPDAEDTPFGKQMVKFMEECGPELKKVEDQVSEIEKKFVDTADYYMLGKNDDLRKKSDKFFKFFTEFFDDIQKCLPKEEKKSKAKAGAAAKRAGHAAMMAELMAKQAKK